MTNQVEIDKEERTAVARYGAPTACPECGHDVFRVFTQHEEEVKLFWDGEESIPVFVADRGREEPQLVRCEKCGESFGLDELMPDGEEE